MISRQKIVNYARALFNIEGSSSEIQQRQEDLKSLAKILSETPDLQSILDYPEMTVEKKMILLEKLLKKPLNPSIKNLIALLINRRKSKIIQKLSSEYHNLVVHELKEIDVEISTPESLTREEKQILTKKLEDKFHKKTNLIETINPALLGGLTILVHNQILDLSIKGKLMNLKKQLLKARI